MDASAPTVAVTAAVRPLLATGLAAAAIGATNGTMRLIQDTRGAPIEWGGLYAAGVRLTGPWDLRIVVGDQTFELPLGLERVSTTRGRWEVVHRLPKLRVTEMVVVSSDLPAIGRGLSIENLSEGPVRLTVESEFRPFLGPVIVEGVKPYVYEMRTRGTSVECVSHGFGLVVDSNPLPCHLQLNRASWIGGGWSGELSDLVADYDLEIGPGSTAAVRWVVWGGLERTLRTDPDLGKRWLLGADGWATASDATWAGWLSRRPSLAFPDAPELEEAVDLAVSALRALYTAPDPELTGLVAGFPWYSAVWCRDLAWALPAVLWVGDFEWAARSVRSVFGYQARRHLPILGGEEGELPMQISPGPIFLFGTSDTTLHYPALLRQWSHHTGRRDLVDELRPGLAKAILWGRAKCDPRTGLFRNGGEVEEIREAAAGIGSVHYGFDAVDTTIWDSTDRRDHAIDLQALWIAALEAAAELSSPGMGPPPEDLRNEAARVRAGIASYHWGKEGYLYDSLRMDGAPVARVRPNALRAVSAGLLPPEIAAAAVLRASQPDLTTPWGLRTLSSVDAGFDPQAYHDGQVWSIATAWAADAAFSVGQHELGLRYLSTLAGHLRAQGGFSHECYRGDRPEPYNSCFLLGFSVAPFLTTVFERLWGLSIGPGAESLYVAPRFPTSWRSARLHSLRIGDGQIDLDWTPDELSVVWHGTKPIRVVGASADVTVAPEVPTRVSWKPATPKNS
jgi:hypothetical protein